MSLQVLIADESIITQKMFEHILSGSEYSLSFVRDGEDALESAARDVPDIVIACTDLQYVDGYSVSSGIRKDPSLKDVRVLLMAPEVYGLDHEKLSSCGADDYIVKPFQADDIMEKIKVLASRDKIPEEEDAHRESHQEKDQEDLINQISVYEKINRELEEKLKRSENRNRDYMEKIQDMGDIVSMMKTDSEQNKKLHTELTEKLERYGNIEKGGKKERAENDRELQQIREKLKYAEKENAELNKKLKRFEDERSERERIISESEKNVQKMKAEHERSESTIASLNEKIDQYENTGREAEDKIRAAREEIKALKKEKNEKVLLNTIPDIEQSIVLELKGIIEKLINEKIPYTVEKVISEKVKSLKKPPQK